MMHKKILLIDDEELIIRSLKKLLEKQGFTVFVARTGQDALVMVEEEEFGLVVADIRMPGMNGVETIQAIGELLQGMGKPRIPVIFITGFADEEIKRKADTLEPLAYFYKPFDIQQLNETIRSIFDHAS